MPCYVCGTCLFEQLEKCLFDQHRRSFAQGAGQHVCGYDNGTPFCILQVIEQELKWQFGRAWRLLYKTIANATSRFEAQRRWCRLALRFLPQRPLVIEAEFKLQLGPAWRLLYPRQVAILLASYYQFLLVFEKSHPLQLQLAVWRQDLWSTVLDSNAKERWRWGPQRASYMYGTERWLGGLGLHIDEAFHDGPGETIVSISLYGPNISLYVCDYMPITYMPVLPVD